MVNSIRSYYKYNFRQQLDFKYRLYQLSKIKDLYQRVHMAQSLMYYAVSHGVGYYSCRELEAPFLDLARQLPIKKRVEYVPDSCLHVMTQAYTSGGHTRVVERWLSISSCKQKHSVVLLDQGDFPIPESLEMETARHSGELFMCKGKTLVERAQYLREIAQQYEYVILHIHMHDPTAIVAFGTNEFKRPVILYNHADHLYWCGASIVDMLADLRDNDYAEKWRMIRNHYSLRIPYASDVALSNYPKTKEESRIALGLPLDKIILLTVGGSQKYQPFAGIEFCNIVHDVIRNNRNALCLGMGPTNDVGNWGNYGEQFVALGTIPYGERYFDYLNACDIYIGSIPIEGGTAVLDAVQFKKPVLIYTPFKTELGEITKGIHVIHSLNKFRKSILNLLESQLSRDVLAEYQRNMVEQYHGLENWKSNLEEMLNLTPKWHVVHLPIRNKCHRIDDLCILISLWNYEVKTDTVNIHDIYHTIKRWLRL